MVENRRPVQPISPATGNSSSEKASPFIISEISLRIPARLDCLPVFGAAVREYCAALPGLVSSLEQQLANRGRHTGPLNAPGSTSYSNFVYSIELLLQEAATNIIRHGYSEPVSFPLAFIGLDVQALELEEGGRVRRALVLELTDAAPPFDPSVHPVAAPDPTSLQESGYGLYLIHKLSDRLEYFRRDGYNHLKIIKYFG